MRQNGFRVLYGAPPTSSSACTLEAAIPKLDKTTTDRKLDFYEVDLTRT